MSTKRMIITIDMEDKTWLEGYSKARNISVAEAIRQGIGKLKETQGSDAYQKLAEMTKGIWKMGDGLEYQQKMRSEWNDR